MIPTCPNHDPEIQRRQALARVYRLLLEAAMRAELKNRPSTVTEKENLPTAGEDDGNTTDSTIA